jgi:hypothetical protein
MRTRLGPIVFDELAMGGLGMGVSVARGFCTCLVSSSNCVTKVERLFECGEDQPLSHSWSVGAVGVANIIDRRPIRTDFFCRENV